MKKKFTAFVIVLFSAIPLLANLSLLAMLDEGTQTTHADASQVAYNEVLKAFNSGSHTIPDEIDVENAGFQLLLHAMKQKNDPYALNVIWFLLERSPQYKISDVLTQKNNDLLLIDIAQNINQPAYELLRKKMCQLYERYERKLRQQLYQQSASPRSVQQSDGSWVFIPEADNSSYYPST